MTLICPKVSNLYLKFEDIAGVKNILVLCITETMIGEKKERKIFLNLKEVCWGNMSNQWKNIFRISRTNL